MKTLVFLPTYNERGNIVRLIEEILALPLELDVLVADDRSPDGTGEAVKEIGKRNPRVKLLSRDGPKGRGYAGAEGFRWARRNGYEAMVEMDADFSHPPECILGMLEAAETADLVILSRLVKGGGESGRSAARRWITTLSNLYIRRRLGLRVRDCTTGFRCYSRRALEALDRSPLHSSGPSIVQETLYIIHRENLKIVERPFHFRERASGVSKLRARTLMESLKMIEAIPRLHAGG